MDEINLFFRMLRKLSEGGDTKINEKIIKYLEGKTKAKLKECKSIYTQLLVVDIIFTLILFIPNNQFISDSVYNIARVISIVLITVVNIIMIRHNKNYSDNCKSFLNELQRYKNDSDYIQK